MGSEPRGERGGGVRKNDERGGKVRDEPWVVRNGKERSGRCGVKRKVNGRASSLPHASSSRPVATARFTRRPLVILPSPKGGPLRGRRKEVSGE